ncbi:U6 snRNA phosphodiesterase 1 isoform X2 [Halichoeres trimaculatus]|uniref:U6 snRNA phosphodiesterase 1 isoform X2 n=1 Tax=Halichoeres trimaculatus TaxID=147232 RepID=UPI003D9DD8C9
MFAVYSSSSEEEECEEEGAEADTASSGVSLKDVKKKSPEEDDDLSGPARKKPRVQEQVLQTRLPLPGCLLAMFPDEADSQPEERALHGGRIRSFKHENGNWATYVYLPYHPEEEFGPLLEELLVKARARGVVLTPQEEFHLSLSQTVVLRHHWIQPFTQSLKASLLPCKRFLCSAGRLKIYCNAEGTRTFLGMEVTTGCSQLMDLSQAVDRTMTEFDLDTFYKDPSFHVSLAWCVGDRREQLKAGIEDLQSLVDHHEEGPFLLILDCVEVFCKTGNKTFRFPLMS